MMCFCPSLAPAHYVPKIWDLGLKDKVQEDHLPMHHYLQLDISEEKKTNKKVR